MNRDPYADMFRFFIGDCVRWAEVPGDPASTSTNGSGPSGKSLTPSCNIGFERRRLALTVSAMTGCMSVI